jgi:hypothetical protein
LKMILCLTVKILPLKFVHLKIFFQICPLRYFSVKVENILKDSLDSIPLPSPSVKIKIMGRKVFLRCKGKTLMGIVNKLLKTKSVLTSPRNDLPD